MKLMSSLVGLLLFLSGCSNNNAGSPSNRIDPVLQTNVSFKSNNIDRNYHLVLPQNRNDAPIVLVLHGQSGSSDQILGLNGITSPHKLWRDIAREENLILVVPDGLLGLTNKQSWNDCRNDAQILPDVNDVQFLDDLIEHIKMTYSSQNANVFAVGISNGGLMTMRLANEIPDKLTAMAIIIASKPANSECVESSIPVPVLFMNGTEDNLMPYFGGSIIANRGEVLSTPDTINYWVDRNQAQTTPTVTTLADIDKSDDSSGTRYSYRNLTGKIVVEHYEITNGGHTGPSKTERYGPIYSAIVGNQNGDIEMVDEVWKFFSQF